MGEMVVGMVDTVRRIMEFGDDLVRYEEHEDGVWFRGKEAASLLGYADTTQALRKNVDDEDRKAAKQFGAAGVSVLQTATTPDANHRAPEHFGAEPGFTVPETPPPTSAISDVSYHDGKAIWINESGLYSLILRSNKPAARTFKKWVTAEVLPTIRKHGGYAMEQQMAMLQTTADVEKYRLRQEEERTTQTENVKLTEQARLRANEVELELAKLKRTNPFPDVRGIDLKQLCKREKQNYESTFALVAAFLLCGQYVATEGCPPISIYLFVSDFEKWVGMPRQEFEMDGIEMAIEQYTGECQGGTLHGLKRRSKRFIDAHCPLWR